MHENAPESSPTHHARWRDSGSHPEKKKNMKTRVLLEMDQKQMIQVQAISGSLKKIIKKNKIGSLGKEQM